jgi:hypothetical protein
MKEWALHLQHRVVTPAALSYDMKFRKRLTRFHDMRRPTCPKGPPKSAKSKHTQATSAVALRRALAMLPQRVQPYAASTACSSSGRHFECLAKLQVRRLIRSVHL